MAVVFTWLQNVWFLEATQANQNTGSFVLKAVSSVVFKTKLSTVGALTPYLNLFPSFHFSVKSFIPPKTLPDLQGHMCLCQCKHLSQQLPWCQLQNNRPPSPFYALGSGHLHRAAFSANLSHLAALASHSVPVPSSCLPSHYCFTWAALQCSFLTGNSLSFIRNIVLFMLPTVASLLSSA